MHFSNYFKVIHELKSYFINRGWNTYNVIDIYPYTLLKNLFHSLF